MPVTIAGVSYANVTGTLLTTSAIVTIGAAPCVVNAALSSPPFAIVCAVPPQVAGTYNVTVNIPGPGFATGAATYRYSLIAASLSTVIGGVNGGMVVTLSGAGFLPTSPAPATGYSMSVTFGTAVAIVQSATVTSITLVVPACATSVSSTLNVQVRVTVLRTGGGSSVLLAGGFTYSTALTASVWAVSPSSGGHGTLLTLSGTGFGATQVRPVGRQCVPLLI